MSQTDYDPTTGDSEYNAQVNQWNPDLEPMPAPGHGTIGLNAGRYDPLPQDGSPGSDDPDQPTPLGDTGWAALPAQTFDVASVTHHVVHHVTEEMDRAGADYAHFVQQLGGTGNPTPTIPVSLLPQNENRREATIVNDATSASAVYVGKGDGLGAAQRFKLSPGATLTIKSRARVYVSAALAGDTATVYAWDELNELNAHILGSDS